MVQFTIQYGEEDEEVIQFLEEFLKPGDWNRWVEEKLIQRYGVNPLGKEEKEKQAVPTALPD